MSRVAFAFVGLVLLSPLPAQTDADRIRALEQRIAKLEALVEKLAGSRVEEAVAAVQPAAQPGPPPPSGMTGMPQELLPNLGKIGAAASFFAGVHNGPFNLKGGSYFGGAVELPLFNLGPGRLLYEFNAGLSRSTSDLRVTSNVAQVANLALLANLNPGGGAANVDAALNGTAPAPFAVQYDTKNHLQLLQVVPFALKYATTALDRFRLRPYAMGGLATFVTITNQSTPVSLAAPFGGALIGGQLTAATAISARGIPSGQGGIEIGYQTGGGLEWRAASGLSFGVDIRYNRLASGPSFITTATRTGWHF